MKSNHEKQGDKGPGGNLFKNNRHLNVTQMKLTDAELQEAVKRCLNGEKSAQEAIFKALYGKMMSVCMRFTRDRDSAGDLVQEGFIKVFQKLGDFGFNGSFEGWVRRIMVNQAIDSTRKTKLTFELIDNYQYKDSEDDNDASEFEAGDENSAEFMDSIMDQVSPELIIEAMQGLSPAYRAVFNLYAIENYSHQQIADELHISVGTSKSNYAKAKQNLKKILISKIKMPQGNLEK
jgi:RNA polymerase sigma-70 factor (ECF subfamily)